MLPELCISAITSRIFAALCLFKGLRVDSLLRFMIDAVGLYCESRLQRPTGSLQAASPHLRKVLRGLPHELPTQEFHEPPFTVFCSLPLKFSTTSQKAQASRKQKSYGPWKKIAKNISIRRDVHILRTQLKRSLPSLIDQFFQKYSKEAYRQANT